MLAAFQFNRLNHYTLSLWSVFIVVTSQVSVIFGLNHLVPILSDLSWGLSFRHPLPKKLQLQTLHLREQRIETTGQKYHKKAVTLVPYTSISSFCTVPLVLLNAISGWEKPPLFSALCQPDKEKATGFQFPFDLTVSLGKRKIFSPCLGPSWGIPHSAASLLFPQAYIFLTGSSFPTGFLKSSFWLNFT